jgi:hypothetical protein
MNIYIVEWYNRTIEAWVCLSFCVSESQEFAMMITDSFRKSNPQNNYRVSRYQRMEVVE